MKPSKSSSREWGYRVKDILGAISKIEKYTENMTLSEFRKSSLVIDAVVRNFEIIGEASNNIPKSIQLLYPEVPWKQMTEMRNFLIHEYFGVDVHTVWQTAQKHLPPLKTQLLKLVA